MKSVKILLVSLLTLYGPIELTRVIIDWRGFSGKFIFEICAMWLLYVAAIFVISTVVYRQPQIEQSIKGD